MKLRTKVRILTLLLILLTSAVSYSQERSAVDGASALIEEFMRNTNAAGVAVTVGVKGRSCGLKDSGTPMSNSAYRYGPALHGSASAALPNP